MVPSCETCTPSYARSLPDEDEDEGGDEDEDEDKGSDLEHTSELRGPLRSTPSTIWEPDGWLA